MGNDENNPGMQVHVSTTVTDGNGNSATFATTGNGGTDAIIYTYSNGNTLRVQNNGEVRVVDGDGITQGATVQLTAGS